MKPIVPLSAAAPARAVKAGAAGLLLALFFLQIALWLPGTLF